MCLRPLHLLRESVIVLVIMAGFKVKYTKQVVAKYYMKQAKIELGRHFGKMQTCILKNSPIFKLEKVSTPILIRHNKGDQVVPWSQSVELFTGLRRLQKRAWMLQYDNGGHGLFGKDANDFTYRINQFFDHYLKGYPPPAWMIKRSSCEVERD